MRSAKASVVAADVVVRERSLESRIVLGLGGCFVSTACLLGDARVNSIGDGRVTARQTLGDSCRPALFADGIATALVTVK
ncbi:MAG: hypothetical protein HYV09_32535 [Deltaproteobacteria bacterium]|nr:hypothetical protein [Deltaproteobacteria bacterium]